MTDLGRQRFGPGRADADPPVLRSPDDLAALSLSTHPFWVFDIDAHRIWWANDAAVRFWRAVDLPSLLARDFSSDSATVRRRLRQTLAGAAPGRPTLESWTLYPLGEPISARLAFTPARLADEGHDAVLIEAREIGVDDADHDGRRLLEATRYTAWMISYFTLDGALLAMNPAAADAIGHPKGEHPPTEAFAARFEDPDIAAALLAACAAGEEPSGEYRVRTNAGARWHRVDLRLGRDPVTGEPTVIAVEEDVTTLKDAIADLEELNRTLEDKVILRTVEMDAARTRAERANSAKSDFLASMSHDLRTPLNAILGFSEILASANTEDLARARFQDYGRTIHVAARTLLALVDDLLDLSRIEAGRVPIQMEEVSAKTVLEDALDLIGPVLTRAGVTLVHQAAPGPVLVHTDRRALSQILSNILSNAAKFTPAGGRVTADVAELPDGGARITIADTGPGIPADDLDRIFDPYVRGRLDDGANGEIPGTGLGLSICKRLADLLSVDLRIEASPGEGTVVTIVIPPNSGS
jgi:signal transduction histidine kinase